jgi:phosphoribosyl 1,2-cyclic phosphodiesterase
VLISTLSGETVVFFTDTYYTRYQFPLTTHWIVECNYIKEKLDQNLYDNETSLQLRNRIVKSHMSLETLKEMFKANDLSQTKEIWLTHLSDSNSDAERMKREVQELTAKVVYIC